MLRSATWQYNCVNRMVTPGRCTQLGSVKTIYTNDTTHPIGEPCNLVAAIFAGIGRT